MAWTVHGVRKALGLPRSLVLPRSVVWSFARPNESMGFEASSVEKRCILSVKLQAVRDRVALFCLRSKCG